METTRKKVLIASFHPFSPEYLLREYMLAASLDPQFFEVYILVMGENPILYPGMVMIGENPFQFERSEVFHNGVNFELRLQRQFPGHHLISINELIKDETVFKIKQKIGQFSSLGIRDHDTILYDDFPVGTFSVFWGMRADKFVNSLEECDLSHDKKFQLGLAASIIGLEIAKSIQNTINPDIIVSSDSLYPHSLSTLEYFRKSGKEIQSIGIPNRFGNEFQFLHFDQPFDMKWMQTYFQFWNEIKQQPCSKLSPVTTHMLNLYEGKSRCNFAGKINSKIDLRTFFGIKPHQHVVILALRSPDELEGARISLSQLPDNVFNKDLYIPLYSTLKEWVLETIEAFKDREDIFLLIRPHPQQNRSKIICDDYTYFESLAEQKIPNVAINMPQDNISAHDILREAELLIAAWSNMILEYSIFDIPVVSIYPHNEYAVPILDLCHTPKSSNEYQSTLRNFSFTNSNKIDWNRVLLSFRWLAFKMNLTHLDFAHFFQKKRDLYSDTQIKLERYLIKILNRLKLSSVRYFPIKFLNNESQVTNAVLSKAWQSGDQYYKTLHDSLEKNSYEDESLGIKESLRALLTYLEQDNSTQNQSPSRLWKKWNTVVSPSKIKGST